MDRVKAVDVIKQIFDKCKQIEGKSIKLMPPTADSVLSNGCQIHITANPQDGLEVCLASIIEENELALELQEELLVIYKPLKNLRLANQRMPSW